MTRKVVILLMGLVVILSGWWITRSGSSAQTSESVVDVWATWGDDTDQLQALFDRFSQTSGVPVKIRTRTKSDDLLEALASTQSPDMVILSSSDLVGAYAEEGLVEPLDRWIRATGIDLEDIYPAPLEQCKGLDGAYRCLPWGCDIDALFWNKDLFVAAGLDPERPPQTMEELVEYAGKLTVRDDKGELSQVGFIPDFTRSHTGLYARMFGGAFYSEAGTELVANSQPVIDALNWQMQFYNLYTPEDLQDFVSSFTPYMTSRHPVYAGRRLDCRQCHRSSPPQNKRIPSSGFDQGRIAMMVDGEWQGVLNTLSSAQPAGNFGVAPFPPPAAHPERAGTVVVQGPVVVIPTGARDKEAAADLLAWMTSPEILAEAAYSHSLLPTSGASAQDPRFRQISNLDMFLALLVHPNAEHVVTTPISFELNGALGQVEEDSLRKGGDPASLLGNVQAELAARLEEVVTYQDRP